MADARRRVKLYVLNDERQWDDRGTGHVSSCIIERLSGMSLLVRSETDGAILLESKIHSDTAYQKQQETLIVWTENESYELALSFQEKVGCDEIWEIICQVQGRDPSVEITQDAQDPHDLIEESEEERLEELPDAASPIHLPPCDLSRLDEISELIVQAMSSPIKREQLTLVIESENYIRKLVELFRICEDLENRDGLNHLYEIMKSLILLNKTPLLEIMFSDDLIYDIIGCLEYDPSVPTGHRHREYLNSRANFREVIPIENHELLNKIHQTYRVQYIQDVILPTPSVFEENILSTLTSFIFYNKMDIVRIIQEDDRFLPEVFAQLTDENTEDGKRRDLVLFLKEFCNFAQTIQNRDEFFRTLSNLGILPTLEVILQSMDDSDVRQASIDIFAYVVEFSPSMVREFIMQEINTQDDDVLLINVLIEQMICDTDPDLGVAMQLMNILRLLLDPENMNMSALSVSTLPKTDKNEYLRTEETEYLKTEKTKFLGFFYKHCMHVLTAPLLANTSDDKPSKDDFQTSQLLGLILELLTFTVEFHTYHIKNYITNKDLLRRVLILLKSRHQFLVLCAVRFFRKIIAMKDDFYNRYIIRGNLVEPIIRTFKNNGNKYNLLNSALIELFEYIRFEDIKLLITHIAEKHAQFLDGVDYVSTFKGIKLKYDQHMDRPNSKLGVDSLRHPVLQNQRFRRDARALDEEEELWFEQEDECCEADVLVTNLHTTNELDSIIDNRKAAELPGPLLLRSPLSAATGTTVAIIPTIAGTSTTFSTANTISSNGRPRLQNPQVNKTFTMSSVRTSSSSPERPSSPPLGAGTPPAAKKAAVVVVTKETKTTHAKAASPTSSPSEIKAKSVVAKGGIVGLVDYDEDSDDDEDDEEDLPPSKRARITS